MTAADALYLALWSKSARDPLTGCRVWLGAASDRGYGYVRIGGRIRRVHRVGWELATGQPAPPVVHHTCRNTLCWEETHLYACADQKEHVTCHWRFRRALAEMDARYRHLVESE